MQCVKLVNAGFVDKVIIFDELPSSLLQGVRTRDVAGFPRAWARFLGEIGSVRPVYQTTTERRGPGDYVYTKTATAKNEPCFYVLEYQDINADKEAWNRICDYLKQNCGPEVRLKEKIHEMAASLAQNATNPLELEPEDIPVIPVTKAEESKSDVVKEGETVVVEDSAPVTKKRGRPKKETVEA